MTKKKSVRVLHISDLHINTLESDRSITTVTFHEQLLNYLIEKFRNKIDYLIASGDFGDQCQKKNVKYAQEWLKRLRTGLHLKPRQVILTPGNHDIEVDKLPVDHQEKRKDFATGRDYKLIPKGYNDSVFKKYRTLSKHVLNKQHDIILDHKDVRFVVLNSSWLSQENKTYNTSLEQKMVKNAMLNSTGEQAVDKMIQSVLKDFNHACSEVNDEKLNKTAINKLKSVEEIKCNWIYKSSLRYSENISQQLVLSHKDKKKITAIKKDDKLTIVVFHHPEGCLHMFERFTINGIPDSGLYKYIVDKGHVLICGHIHPPDNVNALGAIATQLPLLVGGKANPHNEYKSLDENAVRPLFYNYEFTNNEEWHCKRVVHFSNSSRPFPPEKRSETFPIIARKRTEIKGTAGSTIEPLLKITSDKEYHQLGKLVVQFLVNQYESLLKSYDRSYISSVESKWINLQDNVEPVFQKQVTYLAFTPAPTAGKEKVVIGILFSEEIVNKEYILSWITKSKDYFQEKNVIYIPLIVDVMNALIDTNERLNYINEFSRRIENMLRFAETPVFENLLKTVKKPGWKPVGGNVAGYLSEYVFFSPKVLHLLLAKKLPVKDSKQSGVSYDNAARLVDVAKNR